MTEGLQHIKRAYEILKYEYQFWHCSTMESGQKNAAMMNYLADLGIMVEECRRKWVVVKELRDKEYVIFIRQEEGHE